MEVEEGEPLVEESEGEGEGERGMRKVRSRRQTNASGHTTDSFSSRGDILGSEDELDDAVVLDDEFAVALERRNTSDENSSGRTRSGTRPSGSRVSTRTVSSRSTGGSGRGSATPQSRRTASGTEGVPTMSDLRLEEERIRQEEEEEVRKKRDAARRLALERGLNTEAPPVCIRSHSVDVRTNFRHQSPSVENKPETPALTSPPTTPMSERSVPLSPAADQPIETIPFPPFEQQPETQGDAHTNLVQSSSEETPSEAFIPARLPNLQAKPD